MRDRATLYLAELDGHAGGPDAIDVKWTIPAKNLEKSLRQYLDNGTDTPFNLVSTLDFSPPAARDSLQASCQGMHWLACYSE